MLAVQKKNAEDSLFYKSEYVPRVLCAGLYGEQYVQFSAGDEYFDGVCDYGDWREFAAFSP